MLTLALASSKSTAEEEDGVPDVEEVESEEAEEEESEKSLSFKAIEFVRPASRDWQ